MAAGATSTDDLVLFGTDRARGSRRGRSMSRMKRCTDDGTARRTGPACVITASFNIGWKPRRGRLRRGLDFGGATTSAVSSASDFLAENWRWGFCSRSRLAGALRLLLVAFDPQMSPMSDVVTMQMDLGLFLAKAYAILRRQQRHRGIT